MALLGKHYKAIAAIIKDQHTQSDPMRFRKLLASETADDLANFFVSDNPQFDRDKFMTACGIT